MNKRLLILTFTFFLLVIGVLNAEQVKDGFGKAQLSNSSNFKYGLSNGKGGAEDIKTSIYLRIGGFGPSYKVIIQGNTVKYEYADFSKKSPEEETFTVSGQDIQNFIDKLNSIGIKKWKNSYINNEIIDGTSWDISIKHKDLDKGVSGRNNYPKNFNDYLEAVRTLIGHREFE